MELRDLHLKSHSEKTLWLAMNPPIWCLENTFEETYQGKSPNKTAFASFNRSFMFTISSLELSVFDSELLIEWISDEQLSEEQISSNLRSHKLDFWIVSVLGWEWRFLNISSTTTRHSFSLCFLCALRRNNTRQSLQKTRSTKLKCQNLDKLGNSGTNEGQ